MEKPSFSHDYYEPSSKQHWSGRKEEISPCYFYEIVEIANLAQPLKKSSKKSMSLLGFACDEGIKRNQGRIGASEGPDAFREALGRLALPLPLSCSLMDFGNVLCGSGNLEKARSTLTCALTTLYKQGYSPLVVGGGHELAFSHYRALADLYPDDKIGILQLDAHFDLRNTQNGQGSSGSSFLEIHQYNREKRRTCHHMVAGIQPLGNACTFFKKAQQEHIKYFPADALDPALSTLETLIEETDLLYVSLCLDVFHASIAPGVSAPQSLGVFLPQILPLLQLAAKSHKIAALDIAELSPHYDIDGRTARLAASIGANWLLERNKIY